jgi:hypothetical protein
MPTLEDSVQTRLALAALFAALVRALGDQESSFPLRFNAELERIDLKMRDHQSSSIGALEALQ